MVRYPRADRNAVDGVSMAVDAGSFTVLLGPSGCGKSTLLRTVNRLVEPASGRVLLDGADVADGDPIALRRRIGYVIQAVGLFAHMTVAQNVGVVPSLLRRPREEIAQRVDELLALVSLDPQRYRARYPRELSGGEAQRVGVARALAAEPPVLLMDEPFGAVDAIVRASLQAQTLRVARTLGTTIVFVTHDVDEALHLGDKIAVMRGGRIEQHATPLEILARPATPYVAQLLNTPDTVRRLNLITCERAMAPPEPQTDGTIEATATLHESINRFLSGTNLLAVTRDGAAIGSLSFDDVRTALRAAQ